MSWSGYSQKGHLGEEEGKENNQVSKSNVINIIWHVTTEWMDLTTKFSELPWASQKEIVDTFRDESNHQQKIGHCQVHDQHIGWRSQSRVASKNPQCDYVTTDGNGAYIMKSISTKAWNKEEQIKLKKIKLIMAAWSDSKTTLTHKQVIQSKEIVEHWMRWFLSVPVRMEKTTDIFRGKRKDSEGIWQRPRIECGTLRQSRGCHFGWMIHCFFRIVKGIEKSIHLCSKTKQKTILFRRNK